MPNVDRSSRTGQQLQLRSCRCHDLSAFFWFDQRLCRSWLWMSVDGSTLSWRTPKSHKTECWNNFKNSSQRGEALVQIPIAKSPDKALFFDCPFTFLIFFLCLGVINNEVDRCESEQSVSGRLKRHWECIMRDGFLASFPEILSVACGHFRSLDMLCNL